MSDDVRLTYQDIHDAGDHLKDEHERFDRELGELQTYVDGLVEDGYVSGSGKAFQESYTEFTQGLKQTLDGMEGMSQFLHAAADAHEDTDEDLRAQAAGE